MAQRQLVKAGDVEFFVELSDQDAAEAESGTETVSFGKIPSFDDVSNVVGAIASSLVEALEHVKPQEAQIEFGLEIAAKSGVLTSVLVDGGGSSTLKITLTWK